MKYQWPSNQLWAEEKRNRVLLFFVSFESFVVNSALIQELNSASKVTTKHTKRKCHKPVLDWRSPNGA